VAYEAYYAAVNGRSAVTGSLLPTWAGQHDMIKSAWELAATAVRDEVRTRESREED
jgi:hypothetical protein